MKTRFVELKEVFETLQGPNGCRWDKEQTHESILDHLHEEVQEFVSAVARKDDSQMQEELGDLLLHVMFHATIAAKAGRFTIEDVIQGLVAKLKRRHPHVFGTLKVDSTEEIMANWEKIKQQEKQKKRCTRTKSST